MKIVDTLAVAVMGLGILLTGCDSDSNTDTTDPNAVKAPLTGIVTDVDTDAPIKDAVVSVAGVTATTDADGAYTTAPIATGQYTLSATHPDYRPHSGTVAVGVVTPSDVLVHSFTMQKPSSTISGLVTCSCGTPVGQGNIKIYYDGVHVATTAANGTFSFTLSPVVNGTVTAGSAGATGVASQAVTPTDGGTHYVLLKIDV